MDLAFLDCGKLERILSRSVWNVAGYPNYSYYYGILVVFIQFVKVYFLHCEAKAGLMLDSMQIQVNLVGTHWHSLRLSQRLRTNNFMHYHLTDSNKFV